MKIEFLFHNSYTNVILLKNNPSKIFHLIKNISESFDLLFLFKRRPQFQLVVRNTESIEKINMLTAGNLVNRNDRDNSIEFIRGRYHFHADIKVGQIANLIISSSRRELLLQFHPDKYDMGMHADYGIRSREDVQEVFKWINDYFNDKQVKFHTDVAAGLNSERALDGPLNPNLLV